MQAATKYHPDKVKGGEQEKAAGAEKFKEIGEAYGRSECLQAHLWGVVRGEGAVVGKGFAAFKLPGKVLTVRQRFR